MADVADPRPADRGGVDGMGMSIRQCAGQAVAALSGELEMANAAGIGALVTTVAIRVPWLIVDLTGLDFTDGAGMPALEASAKQARQAGSLVLGAPGPPVLRVPDLTGVTAGVSVHSSVEEAAGIASPQRAARPVPESDARASVAGLPPARPGRQQEEWQRWTPTGSPPRLIRALTARVRTGRPRPGPARLQGSW